MNIIHVLDEETISHIAAGEVVERAASIVKELVENSVDAKSTSIKIDISADKNAVTKISINDNGAGMSAEDALLAFRQHATSKIIRHDDLNEISTLGFRGEALASIAAVSKITLTTKERGASPEAVKIVIHGGEIISQSTVGAPEGTTIVVEDIFYNTPARKKFQKKVPTELSHIYDMVERLALSHKNIAFVLNYQGNERFRTYGSGETLDVIAGIFGSSFSKELIAVSDSFSNIAVSGYVTKPGCRMKSSATEFYLSVNSRQIVSRSIQWAVREGFGTLLPVGMYPSAFLDIEIDAHDVDVNVHPTKKEVRFSRERDVMTAVQNAVYNALHDEDIFDAHKTEAPKEKISTLDNFVCDPAAVYSPAYSPPLKQSRRTEIQLRRTGVVEPAETDVYVPEVIAQIDETYILAKNENGDLLIVDQHAAHERIMYDLLLERIGMGGQELIVPLPLKLSRKESAAVPDMLDILAEAGYVLEPFGEDNWIVRSVPVISSTLGSPEVIHEIIAQVMDDPSKDKEGVLDRVLKTAACRAVVKGNTLLNSEQMNRLLRQLMATKSPYTCPHGRPTLIALTKARLDSMFLRT
ncbi:MAG: DNA mismatch repair endonuclease MutL [Methanocorpusculum sp.]|nr:DNA mismatch repair endonuclease MutL [Methanocorpusculum sp.]